MGIMQIDLGVQQLWAIKNGLVFLGQPVLGNDLPGMQVALWSPVQVQWLSTQRIVHCLLSVLQPTIAVSCCRRSHIVSESISGSAHPTAATTTSTKSCKRTWSTETRHFQRPWTSPNPVFKVRPFFDAEYLRNGLRYGHSYYRTPIVNRTQAFKWCYFNDREWPLTDISRSQ